MHTMVCCIRYFLASITNAVASEIQSARKRPLRDRRTTPASPVDDAQPAPFPTYESTESPAPISFPPPPNPNAPPMSGSPSSLGARTNALTRALTIATAKLFGTSGSPRSRDYTSASPRRQQIITSRGGLGLDVEGMRDPQEAALLEQLGELAQKTEVLTRWADEMYGFVKKAPQSKFHSSRAAPGTGGLVLTGACTEPLPDPSKFEPRAGEPPKHAARRRNADIQAEYNAVTCVALYMLLMSFCQKGIDRLRNYHEHMQMRDPEGEYEVSDGFDEGASGRAECRASLC